MLRAPNGKRGAIHDTVNYPGRSDLPHARRTGARANVVRSHFRVSASPTLSKTAALKVPHRAGSRFGRDGQRCGAGIRTQSWDVALSDQGPGFLEVNFRADLNLAQLAEGRQGGPRRRLHRASPGVRLPDLTIRNPFAERRAVRKFALHNPGHDGNHTREGRYRLRRSGRKGSRCAAAARGGALAPLRLRGRRLGEMPEMERAGQGAPPAVPASPGETRCLQPPMRSWNCSARP